MSVEVLHLSRSVGMWRIASPGTTVYYLDLDLGMIVRARGAGSVRFVFDDRWCHLVDVLSYDLITGEPKRAIVRVGDRPRYTLDPGPEWPQLEWRWQRTVTTIEAVADGDVLDVRRRFLPTHSDSD